MNRFIACLAVSAVLGCGNALAASGSSAAPTLKDLQRRQVEIRRDSPGNDTAAKAMENYRKFLELRRTDPALRAEALRRLGDLSLERGELERMEAEVSRVDLGGAEAIRLYTLLLQAHPDYPRNDQVLYQLARAYETTGQPERALSTLDEIVRRYPASRDIAEVHFRRGELLFSAQRYRDAQAAYAEVTRRGAGPFYQQGLYKEGWSLFKQNLNEESLPVFARLLDSKLLDATTAPGYRALESLPRADREIVDDTLRVMSVVFSYDDGIEPLNRFVDRIGKPPHAPLLYSRVGDLLVEKQRYQDGAAAYRAFVAREPVNEVSPVLSTQAIEAYRKGGFAQLVLDGKREYVENYNFGSRFWQGRDRAAYPQVVAGIKQHLTDLAAWHHSTAQKSGRQDEYAQAARWYRLHLQSFPEEADSAQVNYRLAEALYESGSYGEAVEEYERSAYAWPRSADSARAAYAALSAYQKQEPLLGEADRAAWKMRSIESGVKFAQSFPDNPDGLGVLARAAQDLYSAKNLPRAIEVSDLLLVRAPPASTAQRRIAHGVSGQAHFDQGRFDAAEKAWLQARELAAGDAALQKSLGEQLSVAVYRQGEAKRAAGDAAGAAEDFLRIGVLVPGTSTVETGQYDATAELIKASDWPRAIGVLEAFRRDYPRSRHQPDVTQKLAVAYRESGRAGPAALEFERIADARDQAPDVRLEALTIAAEQHEKSGNTARTVALLERLVTDYPAPVAERIETRQRLADLAAQAGNSQRVAHWQREIVKADAAAGTARTDRTRYLAARASLALAAPARDSFRAMKLTAPLQRSLTGKRRALDTALAGFKAASAYNVAEVTTVASFEIAELYRQLGADLIASERPRNQSADVREQYDLMLEELATPIEEQAIELHEANASRVRDGVFDGGVRSSYGALAKLLPARYGKAEVAASWHASLLLPGAPRPAVAEAVPAVPANDLALPAALVSQHGRAVEQAMAGQQADAEAAFRQLMEAVPESAGAAYNLAVLLAAQEKLPEAEAAMREAVRRSPRSAVALTGLGWLQRQRGDFTGAVASYEQALQLDPAHAAAWRNLGVVRDLYLDDPAGAIEPFERYQSLTGEERPVTSWLADVKQRAARRGAAEPATPGTPEAR